MIVCLLKKLASQLSSVNIKSYCAAHGENIQAFYGSHNQVVRIPWRDDLFFSRAYDSLWSTRGMESVEFTQHKKSG